MGSGAQVYLLAPPLSRLAVVERSRGLLVPGPPFIGNSSFPSRRRDPTNLSRGSMDGEGDAVELIDDPPNHIQNQQ